MLAIEGSKALPPATQAALAMFLRHSRRVCENMLGFSVSSLQAGARNNPVYSMLMGVEDRDRCAHVINSLVIRFVRRSGSPGRIPSLSLFDAVLYRLSHGELPYRTPRR